MPLSDRAYRLIAKYTRDNPAPSLSRDPGFNEWSS
jgi:hypothetical protein